MATRSFNIEFINETDFTLKRIGNGHLCHGEWSTQPPETIAPRSLARWRSESGGDIPVIGSIATGTEGWVRYRTTVPNPEYVGDVVHVWWNNPFHGTTRAEVAIGDVPAQCDDDALHTPATFREVSIGDVEAVEPEPQVLSRYGFTGSWSSFAVTWLGSWPLAIYALEDIEPNARTVIQLRRRVRQALMPAPEFLPIPERRLAPVVGAPNEGWVADWTVRPGGRAEPLVAVGIRHGMQGGLDVTVDDDSGYRPKTFALTGAAPVAGFSFPYTDDVISAPQDTGMIRPSPVPGSQRVHFPRRGPDADDQAAMVIEREPEAARQTTARAVDRIRLAERAALELYGEFGNGPAPDAYVLRYARWNDDGKTLIDLLLRGIKPIR